MSCFRCKGRDVHVAAEREWWIVAGSAAEARAFSRSRGLEAEQIEEADELKRPADALLMRVPAPPPEAGPLRRRLLLMLLGVGLAIVLILGFLFTMKAREHLGKGRPPVQQLP
jgi:hypothetical protein